MSEKENIYDTIKACIQLFTGKKMCLSFFLFFKWIQIDWFKMVFTNVLMSFSVKTKQFSGVESD